MVEVMLPSDLRKKIEEFPGIGWEILARKALMRRLEELMFVKFFTAESKITEEDAIKLGKELNKKLAKWYK